MKPYCAPLFVAALLSACAGKVDYRPPSELYRLENSVTIPRTRYSVWSTAIPALGKQFFVINNLDKASGLVNMSYSGDPEAYVDCGRITSYVMNARGERTYDFAGAKGAQSYEVMNPNGAPGLFFVERRMSLEGRMNLIFEEVGQDQTRITANTRYVITREQTWRDVNNRSANLRDTAQFNTGQRGVFPPNRDGRALECSSTGRFEAEVLTLIRGAQ